MPKPNDPPTTPTGAGPAATPPAIPGAGEQDPPPDDGALTPAQQKQLDGLIAKRLERQKRQFEDRYADYDDLKKLAAELARRKKDELSEQERRDAELAEAREKVVKAEAASLKALAEANTRLTAAAIIAAAAAEGFLNPQDAVALVEQGIVTVGEDGKVTGAEVAVKALAADRPYLVRKPPTANINADDDSPTGDDTLPTLSNEEKRIAKKQGVSEKAFRKRKALIEKRWNDSQTPRR